MAIQKKPLENKPANLSRFRPFDVYFSVKVGANGLLSNTYKMKLLGGPDNKKYQVKLIESAPACPVAPNARDAAVPTVVIRFPIFPVSEDHEEPIYCGKFQSQ